MKKYIFYLIFGAISFVSCDMKEDFEQEDSKAVAFAGEWNYAMYSADMSTEYKIYDRNRMYTYNTSADLANEIWIETKAIPSILKLKFKSNFTGDINTFSSGPAENTIFSSMPGSSPDSVGAVIEMVQYKTCAVSTGKILLNAGISKSGNPTDSIYLQVSAVQNTSTFIGVTSGAVVVWQAQTSVDSNVQFVIAGQRATGFVEDIW